MRLFKGKLTRTGPSKGGPDSLHDIRYQVKIFNGSHNRGFSSVSSNGSVSIMSTKDKKVYCEVRGSKPSNGHRVDAKVQDGIGAIRCLECEYKWWGKW